jgi:hypothetical protein
MDPPPPHSPALSATISVAKQLPLQYNLDFLNDVTTLPTLPEHAAAQRYDL